jgi:hypothetical protein
MKAKFSRSYRKADNNGGYRNVFTYTVTGSNAELDTFRDTQGSNLREDENGNPLYFTVNYAGETISLIQTSKGNWIADTSAFAQAEGMLGNFTHPAMIAAMSGIIAKQLLGIKDTETTEA